MIPAVTLADLPLEHWTRGERYEASNLSFGDQLGLTQLGIRMNVVPPGKSGCPFHNHRCEDEIFIILEGEGTYRFGSEVRPIRAGDVLGAPAGGQETAHQILNTGTGPLRYFALSNQSVADVCEYPDSGKFQSMARLPDGNRFRYLGRPEGAVEDYWDGEPGA